MTEQPVQNHDAEDVPAALARDTQDGPGADDLGSLPPSDFAGFAEDGVE